MSKVHVKYGSIYALCGNHYHVEVKEFVFTDEKERCHRCSYLLVRHGYSIRGLRERFRFDADTLARRNHYLNYLKGNDNE